LVNKISRLGPSSGEAAIPSNDGGQSYLTAAADTAGTAALPAFGVP